MSEQVSININPPQENQQGPATAQKPSTISIPRAIITFVVVLGIIVGSGYYFGSTRFWKTYDTTPAIDKREALYTQKAQADPQNPDNYVELGYIYFQKKDYQKAETFYEKAVSLNDNNYRAHYNLGLTFLALGKKDRAVEQYKKAIEISPKAQGGHLSLGELYVTMKDYAKAEPELDAAYKDDPGDAQLLADIGFVKEKLGKRDQALQAYSQSLGFGTNNQEAKEGLARLNKSK